MLKLSDAAHVIARKGLYVNAICAHARTEYYFDVATAVRFVKCTSVGQRVAPETSLCELRALQGRQLPRLTMESLSKRKHFFANVSVRVVETSGYYND